MKIRTQSLSVDLLEESGLPKKFWSLGLDSYIGEPKALEVVHTYLKQTSKATKSGIGIYFQGASRSQKTFLICYLLKSLMLKGHSVLYTTMEQVTDVVFDKTSKINLTAFNTDSFLAIDNVNVTCFDDKSGFHQKLLYRLLHMRTDSGKPTFIGSQIPFRDLEVTLGEPSAQLIEEFTVTAACAVNDFKRVSFIEKQKEAFHVD